MPHTTASCHRPKSETGCRHSFSNIYYRIEEGRSKIIGTANNRGHSFHPFNKIYGALPVHPCSNSLVFSCKVTSKILPLQIFIENYWSLLIIIVPSKVLLCITTAPQISHRCKCKCPSVWACPPVCDPASHTTHLPSDFFHLPSKQCLWGH